MVHVLPNVASRNYDNGSTIPRQLEGLAFQRLLPCSQAQSPPSDGWKEGRAVVLLFASPLGRSQDSLATDINRNRPVVRLPPAFYESSLVKKSSGALKAGPYPSSLRSLSLNTPSSSFSMSVRASDHTIDERACDSMRDGRDREERERESTAIRESASLRSPFLTIIHPLSSIRQVGRRRRDRTQKDRWREGRRCIRSIEFLHSSTVT